MIEDNMPARTGVGEEDTDLAVLDLASGAAVLARYTDGLGAFFEEACFVQYADALRVAELLDREVHQPIARRIRAPLEEVLRCPCGGRRRLLSDVTEPAAVVAILEQLGLPARASPVAPARDPGWLEAA